MLGFNPNVYKYQKQPFKTNVFKEVLSFRERGAGGGGAISKRSEQTAAPEKVGNMCVVL